MTTKYLRLLTDPNVAVRRGSALAIGVLPYDLLASRWKDILLELCNSCAIEVKVVLIIIVTPPFGEQNGNWV